MLCIGFAGIAGIAGIVGGYVCLLVLILIFAGVRGGDS